MNVTASNTDKTESDLNAHGLGEPLDDGEEGVGGEHGRLVRLRVDELAHVEVRRGSLDVRQPSVELQPVVGRVSARRTQQRPPAVQTDAKRVL